MDLKTSVSGFRSKTLRIPNVSGTQNTWIPVVLTGFQKVYGSKNKRFWIPLKTPRNPNVCGTQKYMN
jgi:hypothetical protein